MFRGFHGNARSIPIPAQFFEEVLKEIDDLDELKVTLAALQAAGREGSGDSLRAEDVAGVVEDSAAGLEKAVARGTLIRSRREGAERYFINSPQGRAAAGAFEAGKWQPGKAPAPAAEKVNIFRMYEENIGPLTPLIADALKAAEEEHPVEWVAEAMGIAVKANKRSWSYIEAILRRWKEEGYAKKQDRRNTEALRGEAVRRQVEDAFKR